MVLRAGLGILGMCCLLAGCSRADTASTAGEMSTPEGAPVMKVLYSAFAGSWYPGRERPLRRMIDGYLEDVDRGEAPAGNVRALILPHAGYAYSGATAAYGIKHVPRDRFDRAVVIGPSHRHAMVNQASVPDATHYGTPLGKVPLDVDFIEQLLTHETFRRVPGVHENEHSVQMEVPLLQHALGDFRLVPIVVGQLDLATVRSMAEILGGLVDDRTLLVASTDFTHYGDSFDYVPFTEDIPEQIRKLDLDAFAFLEKKDPEGFMDFCRSHQATICGRNAVALLTAMLSEEDEAHLLHYDTSGRITGDFTHSVSYLSAAFTRPGPPPPERRAEAIDLTPEERERLLHLARATVAFQFAEGKKPSLDDLGIEVTPGMRQEAGAFVTLTRQGRLRGCIGDIRAYRPLYKSVMANALNAAFDDPRFPPVTEEELGMTEVEISALSPTRRVQGPDEIVIGRHGVLLRKGRHTAVYLPQVAPQQEWDVEQTLSHLAKKAGLPEDGWREGATFEVFEATVFSEHPL